MWQMGSEELKRYRAAVLDDHNGAQLEKLLRPLIAEGYVIISAAQLRRSPKGVDPGHPRAALLRHKGLALDFPPIPRSVRHSRALLDWCVERAKDASPVLRWLLQHAG